MTDDSFEEGRRRLAEARERVAALVRQAKARMAEARQRHLEMMADLRRHRATIDEERERIARMMKSRPGRRRRGPGRDLEEGGVPAVPDRPRDLSGGAAAALDFGQD